MRKHLGVILAGLVLVLISPIAAAQQPLSLADLDEETILRIAAGEDPASFGLNLQASVIPAFAFRPHYSTDDFRYFFDGYMWSGSTNDTWLKMGIGTGLEIPIGALVGSVCATVYDGDANGRVRLALFRYEQPMVTTGTPYTERLGDWDDSGFDWDSGYTQLCVVPMHQVTTWDDVDGDGTFGRVNYAVTAVLEQGDDSTHLRIGDVSLLWERQVSPAPATATFNDVPVGAFGFQHVEALAASGITGGCGNDDFCPNATLTRVQMAVFLAKALGLHYTN